MSTYSLNKIQPFFICRVYTIILEIVKQIFFFFMQKIQNLRNRILINVQHFVFTCNAGVLIEFLKISWWR